MSKRRRTLPRPVDVCGLPDAALSHTALYLAAPSRALLAVALTAPSHSWSTVLEGRRDATPVPLTAASRAVLGGKRWEELDFEDIDKQLASRLMDDDVAAVLAVIDARNHLRTLRLAGCVSIDGSGLQILRGSTVLEHFDLSLTDLHENRDLAPEPAMAEEIILPILDSLLSSLKLVHLPLSILEERSIELVQFLESYHDVLERRGAYCCECRRRCRAHIRPGSIPGPWIITRREEVTDYPAVTDYWGIQQYVCGKCARSLCRQCGGSMCKECRKFYCSDCVREQCPVCYVCQGCRGFKDFVSCCENRVCHMCRECRDCGRAGGLFYNLSSCRWETIAEAS